jgi:hypothetical protein
MEPELQTMCEPFFDRYVHPFPCQLCGAEGPVHGLGHEPDEPWLLTKSAPVSGARVIIMVGVCAECLLRGAEITVDELTQKLESGEIEPRFTMNVIDTRPCGTPDEARELVKRSHDEWLRDRAREDRSGD